MTYEKHASWASTMTIFILYGNSSKKQH